MNLKNEKIVKSTWFYASLVLFSFIRAIGTYTFIIPNRFAPGGVSGISSIVHNLALTFSQDLAYSLFNPAVVVMVLNIPLLIWAYKALDKKFAFNTLLCVGSFSLFMGLFTLIDFPQFVAGHYDSSLMFLASIAGGAITGVTMGLMLRENMSLGGTDIIAKVIYKKKPFLNVPWLIFMCDCVVVVFSGILGIIEIKSGDGTQDILVKLLTPVLYSFITLFVTSKTADIVIVGMESSVVFNIITSKPYEIGDAIVASIQRGATVLKGQGIYTKEERTILLCVVSRKQIPDLKKLIKEVDSNAFSYITNAREVNGFGFYTGS